MADRGNDERQSVAATYYPKQVEAVLGACGVEIDGETANDFLCFCPFHGNTYSTSFSVSKVSGKFICFNHACSATGSLVELIKKTTKRNEFEARRLLIKKAGETKQSFQDQLQAVLKPAVLPEFPADKLDEMRENFWKTPEAIEYMHGRGFEDETLEQFKIGYSGAKQIIAVPMYDAKGIPVGVVGRPASKEDKFFKNSKGLPTSKSLWNIHRAKRSGDTVIITESSFDAMRVHQSGYENVVASLGGNFSPYHFDQLDRYFSNIVIMTDFDEKKIYPKCKKCHKRGLKLCAGHNPGRDLGYTIASGLRRKKVYWATFDPQNEVRKKDGTTIIRPTIYPHGAKDAGDMTDEEIRQCLRNAVSHYEYSTWNIY